MKNALIIRNQTTSARGLLLRDGTHIVLPPGELTRIPEKHEDEVRGLFASKTFQKLVDNNLLILSRKGSDKELVHPETPEPPANLTGNAVVPATGRETSTTPEPGYNPASKKKMKVVGHQTAGELVEA